MWESACGNGLLTRMYFGRKIETDIQFGQDFFTGQAVKWDIQVTNPPYSLKYKWLERSYELGKPFCLLVPLEMLGAQKTQSFWKMYGKPHIILFNRSVNFVMPIKGLSGNGAQFPVMWYCHGVGFAGTFTIHEIPLAVMKKQEELFKKGEL